VVLSDPSAFCPFYSRLYFHICIYFIQFAITIFSKNIGSSYSNTACRKEFDPVDRQAVSPLGSGDQRHQPVPQKELVAVEEVEDVKHGGVRQERHWQWGVKGNNPVPRGGGRGKRKDRDYIFLASVMGMMLQLIFALYNIACQWATCLFS